MKKNIIIITIILIISILLIKIYNKEKIVIKNNKKVKQIDYFNKNYINRYTEYKNKHRNLTLTQIIKNVNMNLDKKHYEYKLPAKNLNSKLLLVNKYYYLEKNYIPNNLEYINSNYSLPNLKLVREAKDAFEQLSKQAKIDGYKIIAMSTYRSYDYQLNLYNTYKEKDGEKKADTYSARAGHSEHQTGLSVDVFNGEDTYTNFDKTKEFIWMNKHAHEYGFILRFPKGKEKETGYQYEAWHYRFVGIKVATYIKKNNISFEEYYATKIKDW